MAKGCVTGNNRNKELRNGNIQRFSFKGWAVSAGPCEITLCLPWDAARKTERHWKNAQPHIQAPALYWQFLHIAQLFKCKALKQEMQGINLNPRHFRHQHFMKKKNPSSYVYCTFDTLKNQFFLPSGFWAWFNFRSVYEVQVAGAPPPPGPGESGAPPPPPAK